MLETCRTSIILEISVTNTFKVLIVMIVLFSLTKVASLQLPNNTQVLMTILDTLWDALTEETHMLTIFKPALVELHCKVLTDGISPISFYHVLCNFVSFFVFAFTTFVLLLNYKFLLTHFACFSTEHDLTLRPFGINLRHL